MSETFPNNYTTVLTLSTASPNVTISGTVNADGALPLTLTNTSIVSTGVYGPSGAVFTVDNTGLLTSSGSSPFDFGIVLATGGTIDNNGSIIDDSGIAIFGTGGSVNNTGQVTASEYDGIYLQHAGTVFNSGTLETGTVGVNGIYIGNAAGALVTNTSSGLINANIFGVELVGGGTVNNAGTLDSRLTGIGATGTGIFITNTGLVEATGTNAEDGIFIHGSANITNGSAADTTAIISGPDEGIAAIASGFGISSIASVVDVFNYGSILGPDTGGVNIVSGTVLNGTALDTTALIDGGVELAGNTPGAIHNFGTIEITNVPITPDGINLNYGVLINGSTSDTTALITDAFGVTNVSVGQHSTITNYGTFRGGSINGVYLASGTLTNDATGVIIGGKWGAHVAGYGNIVATNAGIIEGATAFSAILQYTYNISLTNSGTIASTLGATGNAVIMGSGTNLLVDDPGAVFIGTVTGGTGTDTLELGSATTAGTLSGLGSQFIDFSDITFDHAAAWTVAGTFTGFDGGETIAGFAPSDTLVLQGFDELGYSYVSNIGLELTNGTSIITLDITGDFQTSDFNVNDPVGNTTISLAPDAPCFAAGVRILTPRGEIAVENLAVGDTVITHSGEDAPILWIGKRKLDLRRHPHPKNAQPICIAANSFADNVPSHDLILSPDHAVYLEYHLIPAKALLNEINITQLNRVQVTYYHIELAEHAIIFAENTGVESYLETGNRHAFENSAGATILHPDFAQTLREKKSCAPLVEAGVVLDNARMNTARRAAGSRLARKRYG